jgi:hypothetical protein
MESTLGSLHGEIPTRVNAKVPIKIATSNIAGRGLFGTGSVKEVELILSIDRPLLCIVNLTFPYFYALLTIKHRLETLERLLARPAGIVL